MDPSQYLALAHPVVSASSGTAYALAPTEPGENDAGGVFERSFGFFNAGVAPDSSFRFEADVSGNRVGGTGGTGSTIKEPASSVAIVLKTTTIFHDARTVRVAFQVHDAVGRTRVSTSGLAIVMTVEPLLSLSSQSVACGSPDATSGIGECSLTAESSFFSTGADVDAMVSVVVKYSGSIVAMSSAAAIVLAKEPTFDVPTSAGMTATLPHHPHRAGDVITVEVAANTDGQALNVWVLKVNYDADVLTYESTSTSSNYVSAVVTTSTGVVSMSTSGLESITSEIDVIGSSIDIVKVRFKVKTSVSAGVHSDVLGLSIAQMVNEFSVAFANDVTGQVNDEQGGAQTLGQITVRNDAAYVGLFAYASVNELANLAPLSGASASSDVKTYVVYDDADEGNDDVSSLTSCSLQDAWLAAAVVSLTSSNGCTVMTSSDHTTGAAAVGVSISLGGLTTSATFRVWFPTAVALKVSDSSLGALMPSTELVGASSRLERALRLNDTCSMRYQKAELRAYATFSAGDASVSSVDVTDLVGFASSNTAVAALDTSTSSAPVLQGLAPGATEVSVMLSKAESVSMTDATLEVQVSQDVPAVVEELMVGT